MSDKQITESEIAERLISHTTEDLGVILSEALQASVKDQRKSEPGASPFYRIAGREPRHQDAN